MSSLFEELHHSETSLGELILRRRRYIGLGTEVYEVKLGEDFLMSSLFTASEEALGRLGINHALSNRKGLEDAGPDSDGLEVVVGGLGLGYTAAAVLGQKEVASLLVIEYLKPVMEWHQKGLLPMSDLLVKDGRCRFVGADFFACARSESGFDPNRPGRRVDAILVDIDHTPDSWLNHSNGSFYGIRGLRSIRRHLRPGGIFGLWSNDPPDEQFRARMAQAFDREWAEPVEFHNPLQDTKVIQTVYFGVCGIS